MSSRAEVLRTPESLTGVALRQWETDAPEFWKAGTLTEETRAAIVQGCRDWAIYRAFSQRLHADEDVSRAESRAAHEAFCRALDVWHNHGGTPVGRMEMAERGGTIGTRVTDPHDLLGDEDEGRLEDEMAAWSRSRFQVHDGGAAS